jgi:Holliday junction resolvase
MPNRQYQKGARAEYIVRDALKAQGWLVLRAYASKGAFDLLAVTRGRVALVEVKAGTAHMGPQARRTLHALALQLDAEPVLAHYEDGRIGWRRILDHGGMDEWTP